MPTPATSSARPARPSSCSASRATATQANPAACRVSPMTMTGRRPMRSESAPASGEMNIGVAKNGSSRTPAQTGE